MATKKAAGGKVHQGTPRKGRRLGIKLYGGQLAKAGQIIVRQIGSSYHAGRAVKKGRDFTLFALKNGEVNFRIQKGKRVIDVV